MRVFQQKISPAAIRQRDDFLSVSADHDVLTIDTCFPATTAMSWLGLSRRARCRHKEFQARSVNAPSQYARQRWFLLGIAFFGHAGRLTTIPRPVSDGLSAMLVQKLVRGGYDVLGFRYVSSTTRECSLIGKEGRTSYQPAQPRREYPFRKPWSNAAASRS